MLQQGAALAALGAADDLGRTDSQIAWRLVLKAKKAVKGLLFLTGNHRDGNALLGQSIANDFMHST